MRRYEKEGAKEYRKDNKGVQKALKKAKDDLVYTQCKAIEVCFNKNNSKKGYRLVKNLTTVDSRYLEIEGTIINTSRYPYFDISDL